jgi:hypothetical protein
MAENLNIPVPVCTDVNGVSLNEFQYNTDGTVVGILSSGDETNLSYDCCTAEGWTFDPTDTKCYWADTCINGGNYHIVLDPAGNTGAYFQVDEDEKDYCSLELNFSFLLRVDCQKLIGDLKGFLEDIHLEVAIEKVIYDSSLPIPNNLEEIARKDLFNIDNIVTFLDGNVNTGILMDDNGTTVVGPPPTKGVEKTDTPPPRTCEAITNEFLDDMAPNANVVNDFSLDSDWFEFNLTVDNPAVLQTIFNERIKVSIIGNTLTNFAILLDDVQLNKVCRVPNPPPFLDVDCPSFDLKRIIDNKKSWVQNLSYITREFDLDRRETKYDINHEKLSINTKEIDLALNPAQAIENDVVTSIVGNECLLAPQTGCTGPVTTHNCVDLRPFITTEIVDNDDLINMLIDVKNRKTLSGYPTLQLMYHRYLNSQEHCGVGTNALDIDSVNAFLDLIGYYWSDLIEQVVPATTIWGSTVTSGEGGNGSSSIFGSNKFVYRKGTSFFCTESTYYPVPSPVNGVEKVGVLSEDITDRSNQKLSTPVPTRCESISVKQQNYGSEFLGTITQTPDHKPSPTGSTISITETITDECDLIEEC